jgi:undecaprenyl diphosphate synthase
MTAASLDYRSDEGAIEAQNVRRQRIAVARPLDILPDVHPSRIPRHIAIIMDGNGRWAQQRGFPRIFGHRNGAIAAREIITQAAQLGVECLTLYSFSIENWKRPKAEVDALMDLCTLYLEGEREHMKREQVRFRVIGRRQGLPDGVVNAMNAIEETTKDCTGLTLCLAFNYGSRAELTDAARAIATKVRDGILSPDDITEDLFEQHLYTKGLPDPDLLIRTAGENRVSNYLLWQISYAEIHVTDTLWPDFDTKSLHAAVRDFASRDRRFGGVKAEAIVTQGDA